MTVLELARRPCCLEIQRFACLCLPVLGLKFYAIITSAPFSFFKTRLAPICNPPTSIPHAPTSWIVWARLPPETFLYFLIPLFLFPSYKRKVTWKHPNQFLKSVLVCGYKTSSCLVGSWLLSFCFME